MLTAAVAMGGLFERAVSRHDKQLTAFAVTLYRQLRQGLKYAYGTYTRCLSYLFYGMTSQICRLPSTVLLLNCLTDSSVSGDSSW